jgi:FtsZ-interacting cell division protein ZipA
MELWLAVVIAAIVIIAVIAVAAWMIAQRRRSEALRKRFGPEYERAIEEHGDRRQAESELEARQKHVERLYIRPLSAEERDRFSAAWRTTQARFVDDPKGAIAEADQLIAEVMRTRGYPMGDFEQRAADISVDHPLVVENYRAAHRIAQASERGEASTEDLRQALVRYRSLFDEMLETPETKRAEAA